MQSHAAPDCGAKKQGSMVLLKGAKQRPYKVKFLAMSS